MEKIAPAAQSDKELALLADEKQVSYIIRNPYVKLAAMMDDRKQFKCTGKHQYRNQNGVWICQCGRKTTD